MKNLSHSEIREFLGANRFSVIHIDANWDCYRDQVQAIVASVRSEFAGSVAFGYVDCDSEQEYAKDIGVKNTPTIAYYRGQELVAALVGVTQDLALNIRILMNGGTPMRRTENTAALKN